VKTQGFDLADPVVPDDADGPAETDSDADGPDDGSDSRPNADS
jgi:hypothetical protein